MLNSSTLSSTDSSAKDWVLVIDDDEPIRSMLQMALSAEGVEVIAASSATEALDILSRSSEEPVLVLADVMMPKINGLQLAGRLTSMLKRSKLAIMSGHLTDISFWPAELRDITYVSKPFRLGELTSLLASARAEYKRT